ncbi:unnamed protein product [Pylaiella littoralis]
MKKCVFDYMLLTSIRYIPPLTLFRESTKPTHSHPLLYVFSTERHQLCYSDELVSISADSPQIEFPVLQLALPSSCGGTVCVQQAATRSCVVSKSIPVLISKCTAHHVCMYILV